VDLADADAVGAVLAALRGDAELVAEFGGIEHITGKIEGPWPHLTVSPGGSIAIGERRASVDADVLLEVTGPFEATVGSHRLWQLLMKAIGVVHRIAEEPTAPGGVELTNPSASSLNRQNMPSGQVRWQSNVAVVASVAPAVPAP